MNFIKKILTVGTAKLKKNSDKQVFEMWKYTVSRQGNKRLALDNIGWGQIRHLVRFTQRVIIVT